MKRPVPSTSSFQANASIPFAPGLMKGALALACLALAFLPTALPAADMPPQHVSGAGIQSLDSDSRGNGWWATADTVDPAGYAASALKLDWKSDARHEDRWHRVAVPSNIVGTAIMKPQGGRGTVWYRKVFTFSGNAGVPQAIRLGEIQDRDRTYLNGKLIGRTGDWDSPYPQAYDMRRIYIVPANVLRTDGPNVLLVQTKGYFPQISGIAKDATAIGPAVDMLQEQFRHSLLSIVFLSCYGTVGLYFIFLFIRRREGRENLYFALFVFGMTFYELLRSQLRFGTGIPFHVMKKIEYMQLFALMPLFFAFVRNFYTLPENARVKWFDRVMRIPLAIVAIACASVLFTASAIVWDRITVLLVLKLWILYIVSIFAIVIYHAAKKNLEAIFMLCGLVFMLGALFYDLAVHYTLINAPRVSGYFFFMFILSVAVILANRFVRLHNESDRLNVELAQKNEELSRLDALKDEFLASTSHELRTPLHGMIGLSESMIAGGAGSLAPEIRENLSLIASSGHRLANMINEILDMAKIHDEGLSMNLKPVYLHALSGMVKKLTDALVAEKPLKIINAIGPDIPPVLADEDRLRQVMYNLVGNAIKFTNSGTIELSARAVQPDDADTGAMVEVSVSDTGIGVPEEYREAIFEAYRQVDGSDTRKYPGTGLGLAIAKKIVEMHNGTIAVAPGKSGGSVFSFTLPVLDEIEPDVTGEIIIESMHDAPSMDNAGNAFAPGDASPGTDFDNNPVILVVDDDPVNIRVLKNYLEPKNCTVKTATDGVSALDTIERDDSINLVLLDIMMPVMSGYEVCRRIRADHSPEELPVIMLTAKNMMVDIDAAFEAGANDYIMKPFRISELLARVGMMLKFRDIRRSTAEGISVRDRGRSHSLRFSDIVYISSHSKNVVFHMVDHDIEFPIMLKDIIDRLPPDIFVRIHKSHIINIRYFHSLYHVISGRYKVRLNDEDETELPVGPAFLESLRKRIKRPWLVHSA